MTCLEQNWTHHNVFSQHTCCTASDCSVLWMGSFFPLETRVLKEPPIKMNARCSWESHNWWSTAKLESNKKFIQFSDDDHGGYVFSELASSPMNNLCELHNVKWLSKAQWKDQKWMSKLRSFAFIQFFRCLVLCELPTEWPIRSVRVRSLYYTSSSLFQLKAACETSCLESFSGHTH